MFVVGPKCRRLSNQYQPERPEVVEAHPDSVCLLLFVH